MVPRASAAGLRRIPPLASGFVGTRVGCLHRTYCVSADRVAIVAVAWQGCGRGRISGGTEYVQRSQRGPALGARQTTTTMASWCHKRLDLPPRQQNFPGLRRGATLPRGGRGDYFPPLQCVYGGGVSLGGGFLVTRCRRNDKWRPHTSRTTCRVTHGRVGARARGTGIGAQRSRPSCIRGGENV